MSLPKAETTLSLAPSKLTETAFASNSVESLYEPSFSMPSLILLYNLNATRTAGELAANPRLIIPW